MEDKLLEEFKDILELEGSEIKSTDNFREFENWDSLANLSVIAMLDEVFDVHINADDFKEISTIEQLMEELEKRSA